MILPRFSFLLLLPFVGWALPTDIPISMVGSAHPTKPVGFHTVALNGQTFTLPDGFTIELAAKSPLVDRPISGAFDEKGRLYVTDSVGTNDKVADQVKNKPHRIVRLEDTDGDGVFDKSTVFVKNVMLPEGAMWYRGSLYVAAPPHIWKFTDTDDDGTADKEEIWFEGKTVTGCANDLHGPVLGPDGWIYWTKGAFAKQEYELVPLAPGGRGVGGEGGKRKFTTRAAHLFRAKPDGTNIEPVMTGGMDNPVGIAFTPAGEPLICGTFYQHPADGKRDGILHAVYGGVWGKDHDPIYEHPWTSPHLMPILTHLGPAAPTSLRRYESDQFGKEYADNLFCAQFNLRKVSRHVLVPEGSTYRTTDSDFVVSDSYDFHPTDVVEDADGSLLILDTGPWYKLCCPTSQLVKAEVVGAIYRVKKTGAKSTPRAVENKDRTRSERSPLPKLHFIALNRDASGFDEALNGLKNQDGQTRRLAAAALGRLGNPKAIPALLDALTLEKNDRFLTHALTYALIEIGDAKATATGLTHKHSDVHRAVLTALDQMPNGKLDAKFVLAELDAKEPLLKETAWWIAGRHPEWGEQLAGRFADQLKNADKATDAELVDRLVKFAKTAAVQKALADAVANAPKAGKMLALAAMARAPLKAIPEAWSKALLATAPKLEDRDVLKAVLVVLRTLPLTEKDFDQFAVVLPMKEPPAEIKLALLSARPPGVKLDEAAMTDLLASVHRDGTPAVRSAAADALARATLSAGQAVKLAAQMANVNPLEFPKLLGAFAKLVNKDAGLALIATLSDPAVRRAVRLEQVKPIFDKYPAEVKAKAAALYGLLAEDRKDERAKLEKLAASLPTGDAKRGQAVFHGAKGACATCHKLGYVGGNLGPDLTRIGATRTERDLLEAIVLPSASFVRSYEPFRVDTLDGKAYNGLLKKDAPDEVVLATGADQQVRILRADIDVMRPGEVSVMPAGLDQQLTPQDLADLVAFLKANTR